MQWWVTQGKVGCFISKYVLKEIPGKIGDFKKKKEGKYLFKSDKAIMWLVPGYTGQDRTGNRTSEAETIYFNCHIRHLY